MSSGKVVDGEEAGGGESGQGRLLLMRSSAFRLAFRLLSAAERGKCLTVSKRLNRAVKVAPLNLSGHLGFTQAQTEIGKYKFLHVLGSGTFSKVYLVQHTRTTFYYAIKVLNKMEQANLQSIRRTSYEVKSLRMADHPYVARLIGTFQDKANLYLIQEPIPGSDLFEQIDEAKGKMLNEAQVRFYVPQLVVVLLYLHRKGIAFRDLRPENVMLAWNGYLKLIDFGNAKVLHRREKTYTLCGAPEYCAPETISGTGHAHMVDWWSLGVIVFEIHEGYTPFYSENPMDIYARVMCRDSTLPKFVNASREHPHAKAFVDDLLTVDPSVRWRVVWGNTNAPRGAAIFDHPFLDDIKWQKFENQTVPLPKACFKPDPKAFENSQRTLGEGDVVQRQVIKATLAQVEWNRYCGEF